MASNLALVASIKQLKNPIQVSLPNGTVTIVKQLGAIKLNPDVSLHNVFYIPQFKHNLLFVGKLLDYNNLLAVFEPNSCYFQDPTTKQIKAACATILGLYKFQNSSFVPNNFVLTNNIITASSEPSLEIIHARLGHPTLNTLKHMTVPLLGNNTSCDFSCEACVLGKHHKFPYSVSASHASTCFDSVHINLWEKYSRPSISRAVYFLIILDHHTRTTRTYLLHNKTQVYPTIAAFLAYVKTQFHKEVLVIRSDNATEIIQESCRTLFASKGIIHQRSLLGNPQQNGRVERKYKHLFETARTLRLHACIPYKFWDDCLLAATYLINLMPSSVLNLKSPRVTFQ
ncbi:Retrovirus-related Pol polyprotein from transposon RE1 [Bienertia sinuspersici]